MTKSTLFKEFWRSLGQTKGRFLSMVCLMMLGSFALVGLQAAPPDITQTASAYLEGLRVQDLTVLSDYGLSQADMEELAQLSGAQVEGGYLTDVVLDQTPEAWRIFSLTQDLAHYHLVAGRLPQVRQCQGHAQADDFHHYRLRQLRRAGQPGPLRSFNGR